MDSTNYVIVSKAPDFDYKKDYVALPKNYGSSAYYNRQDVKAIIATVRKNLDDLNEKTGWVENIKKRRVIIKPNFVGVYHKMGFRDDDYPQSTDPRVIDAVISYLKEYTDDIIIIEGSGAPVTRLMAKINGTDRIVKRYGIDFQAVEELPVDKYLLPKAQVMKEVFIPRTFSEVVRGEAFYISLPKMKTNAYTGVTLGFKNAMGCLSSHMRYRNHNYNIDKKLVDLLWLFKPDLTIIDGIIGAEGNVPGPVDPVDSHLIISGTNSVETDRVATRIIGHDPDTIRLMQEADRQGFNDPDTIVIGEPLPIPWRHADTSLVSGRIAEKFPNIRFLVGASKNSAPELQSRNPDIETVKGMEQACPGGCLPSIIYNLENYLYMKKVNPSEITITVLLGAGAEYKGETYYFDRDCRAYSRDDIRKLEGNIVAVGTCTRWFSDGTDFHVEGCTAHISRLTGAFSRATGIKNPMVKAIMTKPSYIATFLKTILVRSKLAKTGHQMDVELCMEDKIFEGRKLTEDELAMDYIPCDIEPLTKQQVKQQVGYIRNPIPQ